MKKIHISDTEVQGMVLEILRQMNQDSWRPDYVVGLTRGGLVPANMISQYLNIPMETLKVSLRDERSEPESNLWMAEDAFGYLSQELRGESGTVTDPALRKKILIVDDINDSGATFNWIHKDWPSGCMPNETHVWRAIWNQSVRFAVLIDNISSESEVTMNYSARTINKYEDPSWVVFPWEQWWNPQNI